jgi:hypothetical protein
MADYTAIANATIEPNAPLISATMFALRDNPTAIAEGASGAPRIVNAAIQNATIGAEKLQSGTAERDWVLARCAAADAGAVGTYAFLSRGGSATKSFGSTESGSNLLPSNANGGAVGSAQSGTWRCMGYSYQEQSTGNDPANTTLWLRIS